MYHFFPTCRFRCCIIVPELGTSGYPGFTSNRNNTISMFITWFTLILNDLLVCRCDTSKVLTLIKTLEILQSTSLVSEVVWGSRRGRVEVRIGDRFRWRQFIDIVHVFELNLNMIFYFIYIKLSLYLFISI